MAFEIDQFILVIVWRWRIPLIPCDCAISYAMVPWSRPTGTSPSRARRSA
jgi:hypothetical protein